MSQEIITEFGIMEPEVYYLSKAQEHWQTYQGPGARFSNLDFTFVDAWREAGIPLAAVLLGITRTFERFRPGPGRERIRSIAYCGPEVLLAADQLQN